MAFNNSRGPPRQGGFRSNGPRRGGSGGSGGGFRRSFGPREMHDITCKQCGKKDQVPFKPRDGSDVLCRDCYLKSKGITPRPRQEESSEKESSTDESSEEETDTEEESEEETD